MLNKLKLGLVALLLPLVAFAQSYPSPTFNNLTVQGTLTLSGGLPPASLAAQAANTVLANATASSASPTAFAMPSCSTSTSALQWTSGTGFTCYTNLASLVTANTFTANQSLSTGSTPAQITLNANAGNAKQFATQTAGAARWVWGTTGDAESGSDAGSNWLIQRYHDNGSVIDNPIFITRSNGQVQMPDGITNSPISGSTGSFTTLAASGTVSGTGFSTYLASAPAIGTTAAAAGKFTTLQSTSTFTPSSTAGIVGTATNDSANAGSVGEFISSTVLSGSSVALTSGTAANITSISLTAGDWDVWGTVATNPNASTTSTALVGSVSTTSATLPTPPYSGGGALISAAFNTGAGQVMPLGMMRLSLASTTTVYLVIQSFFAVSTNAGYGFIGARRRR